MSKEELKKKFSSDPNRYYRVKMFEEMDFIRKKCPKCGSFFWTLDAERSHCPNPPCESYGFIGNSPAKKNLDYKETWKVIEKFFKKNGHTPVPSYPVVCRWFPGLYFTVASIVAFQRAVGSKTVFEMPANPLIIPQSCMRFNDIPNVGVTGRHFTNFVMIGQHSIYDEKKKEGYWKDRCVELDFRLLTDVFGIKPDEISFMEDVWLGPNAFGYSLEYYVRGLELGNAVFTEFLGTPENYKQMDQRVIDMGAGLERFSWITQGTPTAYDAVFGPVMKTLLKNADYKKDFWENYMKIAGSINMEDFPTYIKAKEKVAEMLGIDTSTLIKQISPVEALYAIADHSKSILFAVADGGLPSNVGGGYNLRVILRRALGFIDEFDFDIDLYDVCKMHAAYLKDFNPRMKEGLDDIEDILRTEEERYRTTKKRGEVIVSNMISKNSAFTTEKLIELYESNGITPETIEKIATKKGISLAISTNFYDIISGRHMKERTEEERIDLEGVQPTRALFYEDQSIKEFDACVLRIIDDTYVVLDQTAFYGKAGGQEGDIGEINNCRVIGTEKYGDVVVHIVEKPSFKENDIVHGVVDLKRREQITKHHTAVHVIHGSAHSVLGNHVWQAGANKTYEKAHLDITHHKPITEEEIEKIEDLANKIVDSEKKIKKYVLPRTEAEKKYGFTLYQGGAIPRKEMRIVEIHAGEKIFDVEACGGTHCDNTKQMKPIVITSTERIQDGIVRINLVAGEAAEKYLGYQEETLKSIEKLLAVKRDDVLKQGEKLLEEWKQARKKVEKDVEKSSEKLIEELEKKMVKNTVISEVEGDMKTVQAISKKLSGPDRLVILFGVSEKIYIFGSAGERREKNVGELVKDASVQLGGRGGGTKNLAQGIGFKKERLEEVIKKLEKELL